jgi:hypothetical protein
MRSEVPLSMRQTCEEAAKEAAQWLHISAPLIRWVSAPEVKALGWVNEHDPKTVVLNLPFLADFTPGQLRTLVGHECYHVRAFVQQWSNLNPHHEERDAEHFGFSIGGELLPGLPYRLR